MKKTILLLMVLLFTPLFSYALTSETLEVSSLTGTPVETSMILEDGKKYIIEVSGTFTYAPGGRTADAEFAYSPDDTAWFEELSGVVNQEFNLDLLVNSSPQNWLGSADGENFAPHTYSPNHVYRLEVVGEGNPISLVIYDSSYDWNEGNLTVSITPAPSETKNVPDLLKEIIALAKQAKKDKLLKGYEMANIARPGQHALRDLRIYEQRLKQGREEAAQDRYESFLENLDEIDEALNEIAEQPGREEFVAKIRALLSEIRNPSTPPTNNCSSYVNNSQPIVVDNFNNYSDGSIVGQGNWQSYVNGSNFAVQGTVVNEGAKALHNSSFGDSVVGKQGTSQVDGKQAVCFRTENRNDWGFYSDDGNVGFRVSKGLNASGAPGLSFASVSLKQDGNVAYYDQSVDVYSNFATYNDNEWTLLEVEWRSSDKTARYRVNSGTWTDWKPIANSASFTGFDYVNFGFVLPSGAGGVYFDTLL